MTVDPEHPWQTLPTRKRWLLALCGALLWIGLATAGNLHPDDRGWGTHQQLGLPTCSLMTWFGKRCPVCGMTTSWANLVQGCPRQALKASIGGTALALIAAGGGLWLLVSAAHGAWWLAEPGEVWMRRAACAGAAWVAFEWGLRLTGWM